MVHFTTAGVTDPEGLEERLANLEARLSAVENTAARPSSQLSAGELLRRRRKDLRQTQAVAALIMGVNQATVSKWERGERIGWDHAADVAEYLGIAPVVLLACSL